MLEKMKVEIKKPATKIIDNMKKPYMEQHRDRFTGPTRIGTGLNLREDFYSAAFLNWFKIEYITGKPDPNETQKPDTTKKLKKETKTNCRCRKRKDQQPENPKETKASEVNGEPQAS